MGPAEQIETFDRMTLRGQRFFFRVIDCGNNEVLAVGQTYKTKAQRDKTALRLGYLLACAIVPGKRR